MSEQDDQISEHNVLGDAIERLEWDERQSPASRSPLFQVTRRTALTGAAAGLAASLLEACGSAASSSAQETANKTRSAAAAVFGGGQALKFTVISHATASEFFTPTQYGAADACQLLGCSYEWTGSQTGNVSAMLDAIETAVSARVDGIATTIIDRTAFDAPIAQALDARIPVISFNADSVSSHRLAYIGQDLYLSGQEMGRRIASLLPNGGQIALFVGTPGLGSVQPRVDGVKHVLADSGIAVEVVGSGTADSQDVTTIDAFVSAHPHLQGFFAADASSTAAVAKAIQKYGLLQKHVVGGGVDLLPTTQQLLAAGYIDFSIDQQPYLQGFLPILELYLHRVSKGLTGPADVDTGIKFVDRKTAQPYNQTNSRFEGTGSAPGVS